MLHWIVFELAGLQTIGFDPAIKDGDCASLHTHFSQGRSSVGADLHEVLKGISIGQVAVMINEYAEEAQQVQAALISGGKND